jgi:hypothetical protein
VEGQSVGVDFHARSWPAFRRWWWRGWWWRAVRYSAGGGLARLRNAVVLDLGDSDISVRIVEVEAGAREALLASALHAQAIALLAIL